MLGYKYRALKSPTDFDKQIWQPICKNLHLNVKGNTKGYICGHTNQLDQCYATVQCFKSKTSVKKWEANQWSLTSLYNQSKKRKFNEQKNRSCKTHHKLNVLVEQQETYWSNKKVSDFLSIIPFCYTGGQSNLKHGVTL